MKTLGISRGWRVAGTVATIALVGTASAVIDAGDAGLFVLGMAFGAFACCWWWWSR